MKIAAIQKLTLLDYPEHTACAVFLPGCNFRCHYCQNAELVLPERIKQNAAGFIPEEVFFKFLAERKGLLEGVCVTGGEPTIHPELPEFLRKIKAAGFLVKLDTNGNNPQILTQIYQEQLVDYVAMDVKASPERYGEFVGIAINPKNLFVSRDLIMNSGIPYEFRTTLVRGFHNVQGFTAILEFVRDAERYYLQNFQSRGSCIDPEWEQMTGFSEDELMQKQLDAERFVKFCGVRQ